MQAMLLKRGGDEASTEEIANQSRVTNVQSYHGSPNILQDANYNSLSPSQYN